MDNQQVFVFLGACLLIIIWVALPLLPAWITYRITPGQKLGLKGPLENVTLNASGAFAAYVVVLLVISLLVKDAFSILGTIIRPAWTLKANVVTIGRDGKPLSMPANFNAMQVAFNPDLKQFSSNRVSLRLPGNPDEWPMMIFSIPKFGGSDPLEPARMSMKVDSF